MVSRSKKSFIKEDVITRVQYYWEVKSSNDSHVWKYSGDQDESGVSGSHKPKKGQVVKGGA